MRKLLQVVLGLAGVSVVGTALMLILVGPSGSPGFVPGNATMDSEARFQAVLFGFLGVAILWCVKDIERKGRYLRLLALIVFLGGVARMISAFMVGLPHPFFITMMAIELGLPPLIVLIQSSIERIAAQPGG